MDYFSEPDPRGPPKLGQATPEDNVDGWTSFWPCFIRLESDSSESGLVSSRRVPSSQSNDSWY